MSGCPRHSCLATEWGRHGFWVAPRCWLIMLPAMAHLRFPQSIHCNQFTAEAIMISHHPPSRPAAATVTVGESAIPESHSPEMPSPPREPRGFGYVKKSTSAVFFSKTCRSLSKLGWALHTVIYAAVETALAGIIRHRLPADANATSTGFQWQTARGWTTTNTQCPPLYPSGPVSH
ncbi:hypothetical protein B0H14DRAFT_2872786 [Mycena olivaceomarginata]|nr:hypothetical protein B0H14DRAFT_2872786 [Mycena olivaceomarginata]